MRRGLLAVAAGSAVALAGAAPAAAQLLAFADEGGRLLRVTDVPVRAAGSVVVDWGSDAARGTVTMRLPARGELSLIESLVGGRRAYTGYLSFGRALPFARTSGAARVRRGSALCADALAGLPFAELENDRGRMELGLRALGEYGGLFGTRCAGPVFEDVERLLPVSRVPIRQLRRGRMRIRLAADAGFSAHGMTGTVRSTLSLTLGSPRTTDLTRTRRPARRGRRGTLLVISGFRIVSVSGEVTGDLLGSADPVECAPLDSCGMAGTLRLAPRLREGDAYLTAVSPEGASRRALRAAVGLAPGGARPGIFTFGAGSWEGDGTVETTVGRPDEPPCTDAATLHGGGLTFDVDGTSVRVAYDPGHEAPPRTRCPGPLLPATYDAAGPVAAATVPLSDFARRRVELRLTRPATVQDDGWGFRTAPSLTVVLERTGVDEQELPGP
ncbi:MAG TPA: hypothetical protein VHF89_10000 [Solirubrobacteraceae bacterium]|nr:hypothetical protein [Solirubrobacteraceae bacterium]